MALKKKDQKKKRKEKKRKKEKEKKTMQNLKQKKKVPFKVTVGHHLTSLPELPGMSFCLTLFFLFHLHLQHMELSRLEIESELHVLTPQPQQHWIQAASATYTTAHANAESLTH